MVDKVFPERKLLEITPLIRSTVIVLHNVVKHLTKTYQRWEYNLLSAGLFAQKEQTSISRPEQVSIIAIDRSKDCRDN